MDFEMVTYLIIGLVLGLIIGVIITTVFSPKSRKYNQVKHDLDDRNREIEAQKQMIVKHFSHSAEILDNMAKEFRRLYQHMAENSQSLMSQQEIEVLNTNPLIKLTDDDELSLDKKDQPKDYSGNPSGLFKHDENKA